MIYDRNAAELFNALYRVLIGRDAVVVVINKPAVDVGVDGNGVVFNSERYAKDVIFAVYPEIIVSVFGSEI